MIIYSTTCGKDEDGVFKRFFGPINREGGEKRLNVAVTRAKKKIHVLTSMPAIEISDAFASRHYFVGQRVSGREYLQGYLLYSKAISDRDPEVHGHEKFWSVHGSLHSAKTELVFRQQLILTPTLKSRFSMR